MRLTEQDETVDKVVEDYCWGVCNLLAMPRRYKVVRIMIGPFAIVNFFGAGELHDLLFGIVKSS